MNRRLVLIFWGVFYFFKGFFPLHLFLLQLRRSLLMVLFWLLLMAMVSGLILSDYGINQLFLEPEYLGKTGFGAYFIVGVALGLFVMAFHIATYIFYSYRYPFLATLRRPMYRFSFNNSVFPFLFFALYLQQLWVHHATNHQGFWAFLTDAFGLVTGASLMILLAFAYFFSTLRQGEAETEGQAPSFLTRFFDSRKPEDVQPDQGVTTYLRNFVTIRLVRPAAHYPAERTFPVLVRHQRFAGIFFAVLFGGILILGFLGDHPVLRIPAGATIVLLFALYLMVTGGAFVLARTWTVTFISLVLLGINALSSVGILGKKHPVYGLNYEVPPAAYTPENLLAWQNDSLQALHVEEAEAVLDAWKASTGMEKPVLVVLNASGGGLRAAYWTGLVYRRVDSTLGPAFYPQVHWMTGSSGGAIGMAHYRALKALGPALPSPNDMEQLSADILNPVGFTWITSDLFFGSGRVQFNGLSYPKDRGWAFEQALDENTRGLLGVSMADLEGPERMAKIPRLVIAPTILNDGRFLLISPLGSSYLTAAKGRAFGKSTLAVIDAVEARSLLHNQGFQGLRLLSALRTSATFPFVTPLASLPTEPSLQLMDAGVRDNEGTLLSLRYLYAHKAWLKRNVSSVIFVSAVASRPPGPRVFYDKHRSYAQELTDPIVGVVRSFSNLQYYNQSTIEMYLGKQMGVPLYQFRFHLLEDDHGASLSWHLTPAEKMFIREALNRPDNHHRLDSLAVRWKKETAPSPK